VCVFFFFLTFSVAERWFVVVRVYVFVFVVVGVCVSVVHVLVFAVVCVHACLYVYVFLVSLRHVSFSLTSVFSRA
jgi:hypothetical protein